jgi:hypothetical protein
MIEGHQRHELLDIMGVDGSDETLGDVKNVCRYIFRSSG